MRGQEVCVRPSAAAFIEPLGFQLHSGGPKYF